MRAGMSPAYEVLCRSEKAALPHTGLRLPAVKPNLQNTQLHAMIETAASFSQDRLFASIDRSSGRDSAVPATVFIIASVSIITSRLNRWFRDLAVLNTVFKSG